MLDTEEAIHSFIESRVQPTVRSLTPVLGVEQESGHLLLHGGLKPSRSLRVGHQQ